ncbi:MAG: DUF4129 domain-containing protein, partial [Methylococcaceae bacterium]
IEQLVPGGIISYVPTSETAQAAFNWLKQTRQLWSNIDYNWQRWVINYDNKNQSRFLSSLGIADIKAMIYWMVGSLGLITALLSWFLLHQKQRAIDPALRIYNLFCKKIVKYGLLRGKGEGAKDFGERAKRKLPEQTANIDQITDLFIKLRYGKNATLHDFNLFKQLVKRFKN